MHLKTVSWYLFIESNLPENVFSLGLYTAESMVGHTSQDLAQRSEVKLASIQWSKEQLKTHVFKAKPDIEMNMFLYVHVWF